MAKLARRASLFLAAPLFILPGSALAQGPAPTASAAFPLEPAATGAQGRSAVVAPSAPSPPPPPQPAPATMPAEPATAPAAGVQPAPTAALPTPPQAASSPPPAYAAPYPVDPPPPPPRNPNLGFQRPDISLRIDPFNFLLEGRLGLEIEAELYRFLTLEVVPVFVTTHSPPTLNYDSYAKSTLRQSSNGIGAISGAAIDAGLWFGGKPFQGYVLRAGLSNYSYTYDTSYASSDLDRGDSVSHTDRQFFAMIGSHNRWGAFTIAGGFGLAYELNQQNRCFDALGAATSTCDHDTLQIKLTRTGQVAELHPFLYPFDLVARFSLGVVF